MNSARFYGVTANEVELNSHMDTNFAVGTLKAKSNLTQGKYNGSHNPGNDIIGDFSGIWHADNGEGKAYIIYTSLSSADKMRKISDITSRKYVTYFVKETPVKDFSTYPVEGDEMSLQNKYTPETKEIKVVKVWDDGGNESRRPSSIKIRLYADGVEVASKDVTARDGWKWSFTDIPLNKAGKIAEPIVYSISEDNVPNYTTSINGFNVRNTYDNPPTPPGETPPPLDPPRYTPPRTPEPTPTPEIDPLVLGASRRPGGSVLGAKRSMQPAVLGKRRRPTTGDSLAIFYYMAGFIGSLGGAITSGVKLKKLGKKSKES